MNKALMFPFGFYTNDNTPTDARYFRNFNTTGTKVPYVSVAEANTLLVTGLRHIGLTININNVEYWYKDGILDADLIVKTASSNLSKIKEFYITGDSTNNTFTLTHLLNNRKLAINVSKDFGNYEQISPRQYTTTLNSVTVEFQTAPIVGENYNIEIIGIDKSGGNVPNTSGFSGGFN